MSERAHSPYNPPASGTRCGACSEPLSFTEVREPWACPECGARVHHACLGALERCPTAGCAGEVGDAPQLEYHEMLQQRDGWILRFVPATSAALGAVIGGLSAFTGGLPEFSILGIAGLVTAVLVGALLGFMSLGLVGTVLAFVGWELYRKLSGAPEPWD